MYTVTFDLDGTLLRSPFWRLHLRPWLARVAQAQSVTVQDLWDPLDQAADALWRTGDWVGAFDWGTLIEKTLGMALPSLDDPDPQAVRRLVMPYVAQTLPQLLRLPVRYAVVTNGLYAYQVPYLRALGWLGWLSPVITPDLAGTAKPDPRVFSSLGSVLCHVGDRPDHDTVAARRAGVVAVQCGPRPTGHDRVDRLANGHVQPDWEIEDFRELPQLIQRLLAQRTRGYSRDDALRR